MKRNYPWKVQQFEKNVHGRDFVAGDLHGEFALLEHALVQINFDTSVDRLFCVGDLIDRGPQSNRVIEFLNYDWFYSIAGNHEWMLYNCHDDNKSSQSLWFPNGGSWWESLTQRVKDDIVEAIHSKLCALISIQTEDKTFGLVHALVEPGYSWPVFCNQIESDQLAQQQALWERDYELFNDIYVNGVDQIFCGHTPVNRLFKFSNFINIDTGCGHSASGWLQQPALTIVVVSEPLKFFHFPSAK